MLILSVIMMSVSLFANELEYENLNSRFDSKSNAMILDENAPCNQDGEPLYEFLSKMDDSTYIKERFRPEPYFFGDTTNLDPWMPEPLSVTNSEMVISYTELKPCWIEMSSSWFDVSADKAFHIYGEKYPDGIIAVGNLCVFRRIDGKWYFVGFSGI